MCFSLGLKMLTIEVLFMNNYRGLYARISKLVPSFSSSSTYFKNFLTNKFSINRGRKTILFPKNGRESCDGHAVIKKISNNLLTFGEMIGRYCSIIKPAFS